MRVVTVFSEVGFAYLGVNVRIWLLHKSDIFLHAASPDAAFVPRQHAAEPGSLAPVDTPNIKVITDADNPDDHRVSQCAEAIRSSSASPILLSSLFVQVVITRLLSLRLNSILILFVGDGLYSVSRLAVEIFLNGDVGHGRCQKAASRFY